MTLPAASPGRRLLWPREHGAWGQVLTPLVTALASGTPGLTATLLATAAASAFLGHEALLVLLGQRGPRLRERRAADARRTLWIVGPVALVTGLGGLALAATPTRLAVAAITPLALLLGLVIATGREKTTAGEALAAATAAAIAVPAALAAGVEPRAAVLAWLTWTLAFGAATGGVRWLLSRHKGKPDPAAPGLLTACSLLVGLGALSAPVLLAAVPQVAVAWALVVGRPHPRHLKRAGWTLVAASVVTAVVLVVATRGGG